MRHFDYRMSKAVSEERLTQARRLRRPAGKEQDPPGQLVRVRRRFGRWLIASGQRLNADGDTAWRGREGVEPVPPN